jgi:hypothetical protein
MNTLDNNTLIKCINTIRENSITCVGRYVHEDYQLVFYDVQGVPVCIKRYNDSDIVEGYRFDEVIPDVL